MGRQKQAVQCNEMDRKLTYNKGIKVKPNSKGLEVLNKHEFCTG